MLHQTVTRLVVRHLPTRSVVRHPPTRSVVRHPPTCLVVRHPPTRLVMRHPASVRWQDASGGSHELPVDVIWPTFQSDEP